MPDVALDLPQHQQLAADQALTARVLARAAGAEAALVEMVRRIGRPIIERRVDRSNVDDVLAELVQKVWDRNWRVIREWRQEGPLAPYLGRLAKRVASDFRRRRRAPPPLPNDWPEIDTPDSDWHADPVRVTEALDARNCLERATEQLSPPHEAVVRLRHFEGLGHREIAERLGRTPGYVGPTLARAELELRRLLHDHCRELIEKLIGTREPVHG